MVKSRGFVLALASLYAVKLSQSSDAPRWYKVGERVDLNFHKLSSATTWISKHPYTLPFCQPEERNSVPRKTLGQVLVGETEVPSPYLVEMKNDAYCQQLCISNLGSHEMGVPSRRNKVVKSIFHNYHHNWSLDGLPSASKRENESSIVIRYFGGFPIGYLDANHSSSLAYVYNHVNIEVMYHPVRDRPGEYNVVRFIVEPFSIQHDFEAYDPLDETTDIATISNPIESCNPDVPQHHREHTSWDMITEKGRQPQTASGKVLFTYDVIWIASSELEWASRWDIYISMDDAVPARVHLFFILNSFIPFVSVSSIVLLVLVCKLRNNLPTRYISVMLEDDEEEQESRVELCGWKALHKDVFRPPPFHPLLFYAMCGVGTQILCASLTTLTLCYSEVLTPAKQGSIAVGFATTMIAFSPMTGYVAVRLNKSFSEKVWTSVFKVSAILFHGSCCLIIATMDVLFTVSDHAASIGAARMLVVNLLMGVLSAPLIFAGSYFASRSPRLPYPKQQEEEHEMQSIARPIPMMRRWKRHTIVSGMFLTGLLPLLPGGAERYFLYHAIWNGQYYHSYGYLLFVTLETFIVVAEVTLLFHAIYLCAENHRWWWRSFCIGGLPSLYMFLFSINFFYQFLNHEEVEFPTYVMFFGCMLLVCFNIFVLFGTIGVLSCLALNMAIYKAND